jgi:ammonium transporter Rh
MNDAKVNLGLTSDEIKLFKDDPETFREYLKYKTRQMEINAEIIKKNVDKETEEHMRDNEIASDERVKSYELKLKYEVEENDRKRKAEAEENDKRRAAEAEENDKRRQAQFELEEKRRIARDNMIYTLIGASSAIISFLAEKDGQKQMENKPKQIDSN